jgi:hypothetical protein
LSETNRLEEIVERCRADHQPDLSAELAREMAAIQNRFQFSGAERGAAQKEMKAVLEAALRAPEAGA